MEDYEDNNIRMLGLQCYSSSRFARAGDLKRLINIHSYTH